MWTQFVLRALAELPQIISTVEHLFPTPGSGEEKLIEVITKQGKVEGDTSIADGVPTSRGAAIEALVLYANALAAAERGLRPGRTGGPAVDQPATQSITSPPKPVAATPTPDQSLAAAEIENNRVRAEQEAAQALAARRETARVVTSLFSFPPDDGHLLAYLEGRSAIVDLAKDMIERNGGVVPEGLPAEYRPVAAA